jgi:hypothetical protein
MVQVVDRGCENLRFEEGKAGVEGAKTHADEEYRPEARHRFSESSDLRGLET